MPSSATIVRAMRVACSMSELAPEVGSPKMYSSAARPPIAMTMRAIMSARVIKLLSSSGTTSAWPPVRPRARMVTLWTGSRSSIAHAARAWPDSW